MSDLSDVLSAQSLLLAVNAALYTLWSADLQAASDVTYVGHIKANNKTLGTQVSRQLWTRAFPLLFYSIALTLVLIPSSMAVLATLAGHDSRFHYAFDSLGATLVLVHLGFLMFTLHLAIQTAALFQKWRDYRKLT
jgi:hypothetical protein